MKRLLLTSTILALSALPLNAQEAAKSGKFAKKDFSALLDYACELAEISPPRIKK